MSSRKNTHTLVFIWIIMSREDAYIRRDKNHNYHNHPCVIFPSKSFIQFVFQRKRLMLGDDSTRHVTYHQITHTLASESGRPTKRQNYMYIQSRHAGQLCGQYSAAAVAAACGGVSPSPAPNTPFFRAFHPLLRLLPPPWNKNR